MGRFKGGKCLSLDPALVWHVSESASVLYFGTWFGVSVNRFSAPGCSGIRLCCVLPRSSQAATGCAWGDGLLANIFLGRYMALHRGGSWAWEDLGVLHNQKHSGWELWDTGFILEFMLYIALHWAPEEVLSTHQMGCTSHFDKIWFTDHFTDVGLEQFLVPVGVILPINFFSHSRKMKWLTTWQMYSHPELARVISGLSFLMHMCICTRTCVGVWREERVS